MSKVAGKDYLLSADPIRLRDQLTPETRLLVVGSERGSVTGALEQLVNRARELNPGVRVVVYASVELPELNPDATIIKGAEHSAEQFVGEVAHVIDMARNAPRAAEVFSK